MSAPSAQLGRAESLTRVGAVYVVAVLVALACFGTLGAHPLVNVGVGMLAAMAVTFAGTLVWRNGSVFDPYWSVLPPFVALYLAGAGGSLGSPACTALLLVVFVWAVRLTANWAIGWPGLHHEDWRYVMLYGRVSLPRWAVQLLGVELFPTLVIFVGCLPLWPALDRGQAGLGPVGWLAAGVGFLAAGLELAADEQRRAFATARPGALMDVGLWRWCRHPNYLGEILFWVSLWLFAVDANPMRSLWSAIGPLAMIAMFAFASIPMMDTRSAERRPGWAEYAARTPALWPRRPQA